jgi:hypothetical protein
MAIKTSMRMEPSRLLANHHITAWRSLRKPKAALGGRVEEIGEILPEWDREWGAAFSCVVYLDGGTAIRHLDPDWRAVMKRMPPAPSWTRPE